MTHAVIFDIDGTLLDSSAEDEELYKQAVRNVLGDVIFRASLHEYTRVTDSGILLQVLDDNRVAAEERIIERIRREFFRLVEAHVSTSGPFREIPGARAMLGRLKDSPEHGVAIATGGWRHSARIKLASAGFDLDGIPLVSSDDAIDRTEIMRIALEAIGMPAASITYFGDGAWDRQACECLGWTFRPVGPALNGLSSFEELALEPVN